MTPTEMDANASLPVILVHGASHGAWCWYRIVASLRGVGVDARAIDLPGHGMDRTPLPAVTLDSYADRVIEALAMRDRPSLLVAHSMGGIVASTVAERRPDLVAGLVYVSAFLLSSGETIGSFQKGSGLVSDFFSIIIPGRDAGTVAVAPGRRREILYAQSPDADVELARMLLAPQPVAPLQGPVVTSAERFGTIPKFFVRCLQDRVITLEMQDRMLSKTRCDHVFDIDTDHSPFFSRSDELHKAILDAAAAADRTRAIVKAPTAA